jgi:hypothetical protein
MGMKLPVPHLITTPRLELQRLKYEDADEIFYTYASKPEVTRFVSSRHGMPAPIIPTQFGYRGSVAS